MTKKRPRARHTHRVPPHVAAALGELADAYVAERNAFWMIATEKDQLAYNEAVRRVHRAEQALRTVLLDLP